MSTINQNEKERIVNRDLHEDVIIDTDEIERQKFYTIK